MSTFSTVTTKTTVIFSPRYWHMLFQKLYHNYHKNNWKYRRSAVDVFNLLWEVNSVIFLRIIDYNYEAQISNNTILVACPLKIEKLQLLLNVFLFVCLAVNLRFEDSPFPLGTVARTSTVAEAVSCIFHVRIVSICCAPSFHEVDACPCLVSRSHHRPSLFFERRNISQFYQWLLRPPAS